MTPAPMIKNSNRGLLHKHLGIPMGTKIPLKRLMAAKKSPAMATRKEANFAVNFGK